MQHGINCKEVTGYWYVYTVTLKRNVVILMTFSTLAATEVVILTIFGATSDETFVKISFGADKDVNVVKMTYSPMQQTTKMSSKWRHRFSVQNKAINTVKDRRIVRQTPNKGHTKTITKGKLTSERQIVPLNFNETLRGHLANICWDIAVILTYSRNTCSPIAFCGDRSSIGHFPFRVFLRHPNIGLNAWDTLFPHSTTRVWWQLETRGMRIEIIEIIAKRQWN